MLDHIYMSMFSTCGLDPAAGGDGRPPRLDSAGAGVLVLFALPTVLASAWRPGIEARRREARRPCNRLARHLFDSPPRRRRAKEVRVTGSATAWSPRRAAWTLYGSGPGALGSALWHTLAWAVFRRRYVARWRSAQ